MKGKQMSLTSNYTKINTEGWTDAQTDSLSKFCFPMMSIDMDKITKDIFRTPIDNLDFYELLKSYVGYECNVSEQPRYKFIRRWVKTVEHDVPAGCLMHMGNNER
jgi:hypothetical protein